jgi:hypothetical protein
MPVTLTGIHITNILGVIGFLALWFILFWCAHMLVTLLHNNRLIAWAIGPLGVTVLFMREPSTLYILLDAIVPAIVSGCFLYLGLFTAVPSPIFIPHRPWIEIVVIACGVFITSFGDFMNALRDLRYPLWGEARVLRSIQFLRTSWASIHFTRFGLSYLQDHFGSSPHDLLQALSRTPSLRKG